MNKDYAIKKSYANQKNQVPVNYFVNGVKKQKEQPLCFVEFMVGNELWTVEKLIHTVQGQAELIGQLQTANEVLGREVAKNKEALKKTVRDLITGGLE